MKSKVEYGAYCRAQDSLFQCVGCNGEGNEVFLHLCLPKNAARNQIFRLPEFRDKTCFQIYHSPEAKGLWVNRNVCNSHLIYQRLKTYWQNQPDVATAR